MAGRELGGHDDVRVANFGADLVQLDGAVFGYAGREFGAIRGEGEETDAVAERRADQSAVGRKAKLLDEPVHRKGTGK